jgi:hypothetical protein
VRVRAGDPDCAFDLRGVEARLLEDQFHMVQRDGKAAGEFLRARAQRIAAARHPHEERVGEHLAKARQRPAHRWLAEADICCSEAHTAPPQQRFERRQQVEVESSQIHITHTSYTNYAFFIYTRPA